MIELAIASVQNAEIAFCKFISPNDAGLTGAHQSGFYVPKTASSLLFDEAGIKGTNKDRMAKIKWQNDFETDSRFIYYGNGTRNEYRITRFGNNFPFLNDENVGNLFILSKIDKDYYEAFILNSDEDFETFFSAFNINAGETNKLIPKSNEVTVEEKLFKCFNAFILTLNNQFPATHVMAQNARDCFNASYRVTLSDIILEPDKRLLNWLESEFQLFKTLENNVYAAQLSQHFSNVEQLVSFANTILNRRKSRAGKSLEFHLEEIFRCNDLSFETQVKTEGHKKPDFIFPSATAYHDDAFDTDKLIFLASKTTCKDRWRQVINEADRIETKHLFTLQQGISSNQLVEMSQHNVKLVVPAPNVKSFPEAFRSQILTLEVFLQHVKIKQS